MRSKPPPFEMGHVQTRAYAEPCLLSPRHTLAPLDRRQAQAHQGPSCRNESNRGTRVLPGLQDRQHFFGKELQASFRKMERRASKTEGDVQLEIAEQGPAVLKPP